MLHGVLPEVDDRASAADQVACPAGLTADSTWYCAFGSGVRRVHSATASPAPSIATCGASHPWLPAAGVNTVSPAGNEVLPGVRTAASTCQAAPERHHPAIAAPWSET